jgi:hypothetical protein
MTVVLLPIQIQYLSFINNQILKENKTNEI